METSRLFLTLKKYMRTSYNSIQSNLSWNKHINPISLKVSKTIGMLYRLKSVYPLKVLQTLYNTLMLPYFILHTSWGSVLKNNHHLHLLQKKAIRIITKSFYGTHRTFVKGIGATENN